MGVDVPGVPYNYAFGVEPVDISSEATNTTTNVLINEPTINNITVESGSLKLNTTSGDIGFNNNTYIVHLNESYEICNKGSPYILLHGDSKSNTQSEITTTYNINNFPNDYYLYIANVTTNDPSQPNENQSISCAPIFSIVQGDNGVVWINYGAWTLIAGNTQQTHYTDDGKVNLWFQESNTLNKYTLGDSYTDEPNNRLVIQNTSTEIVQMLLANTSKRVFIGPEQNPFTLSATINVDWFSSTVAQNGTVENIYLTFNLPGNEVNTPLKLDYRLKGNASSEGTMTNSFVASTNALFDDSSYVPPTMSFDDNRDMFLSGGFQNYIPSLLGGSDYTLKPNLRGTYDVIWENYVADLMDSDQCRMPWRLANYVRAAKGRTAFHPIVQIAKNVAYAMYESSVKTNPSKPTDMTLGINVYSLRYNGAGMSGDMIPPFLALIDALYVNGYILDGDVLLSHALTVKTANMSDDLQTMITSLRTGRLFPFFDSYDAGGQQLGLSGVSMMCTVDFLFREVHNVMKLYDQVGATALYGNKTPVLNDNEFENVCKIFKMLWMKGKKFKAYEDWGNESTDYYGDQILKIAYLTNIRIRDINISKENELCFGPNLQTPSTAASPSYINGGASYYTKDPGAYTNPADGYIPTYFPIYGFPDSGWGSITVEIISYIGVTLVGLNDYPNFCRWHRLIYYLLFQQNGGNMFDWSDSDTDKIKKKVNNTPSVKNKNDDQTTNFWLPEFLQDDTDDDISQGTGTPNWFKYLSDNSIHFNSIYNWPDKYNADDPPYDPAKTYMWVNRFNPYRGDSSAKKVQWSTPSYCMGYSPAYVVGGKTTKTWSDDSSSVNRPVAEALNPYFSQVLGLYSATDGDTNIYVAYKLASLKWTTEPTNASSIDPTEGYDCDVADFAAVVGKAADPNGYGSGVLEAVKAFSPSYGYQNKLTFLTDVIGYGITPSSAATKGDPSTWTQTKEGTERVTTWSYIANAIQRTMISNNGNGFDGNFGNFPPNNSAPRSKTEPSSRLVTLGHDTSAMGTVKMDYQDLRMYEICSETAT